MGMTRVEGQGSKKLMGLLTHMGQSETERGGNYQLELRDTSATFYFS